MSTKYRILVIDDEPIVTMSCERILEQEGLFEIRSETDALRGLEKAITGKFDLILLDIGLPDMSGWEFLRTLRERVEWRAVPVVVVSAFVEPSDAKSDSYPEYQRYLSKMETARELVPLVREVLESAGQDEAAPSAESESDQTWPLAA